MKFLLKSLLRPARDYFILFADLNCHEGHGVSATKGKKLWELMRFTGRRSRWLRAETCGVGDGEPKYGKNGGRGGGGETCRV